MATNFDRKSVFAEHLKGSSCSSYQRTTRDDDGSNSLDDLFATGPSVEANRKNKPGRLDVKTW